MTVATRPGDPARAGSYRVRALCGATLRVMDEHEFDEGLDPEGPSAEDLDRFGGETRTCPHCASEVWDQAVRCHVCGEEIDRPPHDATPPLPMWAWIALFFILAAFLLVFVF